MVKNRLQIIFCPEYHHWIIASTVRSVPDIVIVVDALFKSVDAE